MTTPGKYRDPTDRYLLKIDGHHQSISVHRAEGGYSNAHPVEEVGAERRQRAKHMSSVRIDPLMLEVGPDHEVLAWISGMLTRKYDRRNLELLTLKADGSVLLEMDVFDGLISEVALPRLERGSKGTAFLQMKIQPERSVTRKSATQMREEVGTPFVARPLSTGQFEISIDGLLSGKEAATVSGLVLKQGMKALYTGADRMPQYEPTKISQNGLTIELPEKSAAPLLALANDAASRATAQTTKSGSISYMHANGKLAFRINLFGMGVKSVQAAKGKGAKTVKADLFVERVELDAPDLGLE